MCEYCEFKEDRGEIFALDQIEKVPEETWFSAETMIATFLRISKHTDGYYLSQQMPYCDKKENIGYGTANCKIVYCPFCGRKLEK